MTWAIDTGRLAACASAIGANPRSSAVAKGVIDAAAGRPLSEETLFPKLRGWDATYRQAWTWAQAN